MMWELQSSILDIMVDKKDKVTKKSLSKKLNARHAVMGKYSVTRWYDAAWLEREFVTPQLSLFKL